MVMTASSLTSWIGPSVTSPSSSLSSGMTCGSAKLEANATAENKTVSGDQTGGEPPSSGTEEEQLFEDVNLEDGSEDGGRSVDGEEETPGFENREGLDENESSGDSGHDEL